MLRTTLNQPIFLILISAIMGSSLSFAQSTSSPKEAYARQCVEQQRMAHQGIPSKGSEPDFKPYCSCLASALEGRLSSEQFQALESYSGPNKPAWLKQAEGKAGRSCMVQEPRLQV